MVYTVTFNPALDYVVRVGTFRDGDINRAENEDLQFGRKGINVKIKAERETEINGRGPDIPASAKERDYRAAHCMGAAAGAATAFSDGMAAKPKILALLNAF